MSLDHGNLKNWKGYRLFLTAGDFACAAAEYFEWVDEHPLLEDVVSFYQGEECRTDKARMRPYTKQGLAHHVNIPVSRIDGYKKQGGEWADVVEAIETVLYRQKFEGAAAGLLSATIISRDLGLADKQEMSGPDGKPIPLEDMTRRDADAFTSAIAGLAARSGTESVPGDADAGGES